MIEKYLEQITLALQYSLSDSKDLRKIWSKSCEHFAQLIDSGKSIWVKFNEHFTQLSDSKITGKSIWNKSHEHFIQLSDLKEKISGSNHI